MDAAAEADAFRLINEFLREDEHYLDSSGAYGDAGPDALRRALSLFLARPELGFVWLSYDGAEAVGACVVCYAVSTSAGGVVAKLDDFYVVAGRHGQGIGSTHVERLKEELRRAGVKRIDTSVHLDNGEARRFYERQGFVSLREERLACVI
jgi:GNAT superfamily N-acetyltransferase